MLEKEISRRNFVRFSVVGAGATAVAMSADPYEAAAETIEAGTDYPNQIKIVHLSDVHYFSQKLYADCGDFTIAENSDRKMFRESGAIVDKALAEIVAYQPDLVILSGDLTKDGELVCHQGMHEKLAAAKKQLANAGKQAMFCVINGNHDINNDDNGRDFSSGKAEHTDLVDPLAFKGLYADCGYDDAIAKFDEGGSQGGSLSYVVRPAKGVTLIVVDSGKYSADQNGLGRDEHVTSGVVGEKLLAWVESQAKQARAAGDIVFVTQHHGVIPHFSMEPELMGEYLVDNYEDCQRRYADAGVSAVFTGHMHANDIASITTEAGNTLYDIETCATVTYPSDIRFATLSWKREEGTANVEATLAVENHPLGSVDYVDFDTKATTKIADITAYGEERLLTVDVIKTMIADALVSPAIDDMVANGGVKPALAGLLGGLNVGDGTADGLDPALFNMLLTMLPQSQDEALAVVLGDLSFLLKSYGTLGIWSDAAQQRIILEQLDGVTSSAQVLALSPDPSLAAEIEAVAASVPMAAAVYWSYYIDATSFAKFMATLYANIDAQLLQEGRGDTLNLLRSLIEVLVNEQVSDDGKTLFDLIKFAYGDHLYGDETCPSWVEAATANMRLAGSDSEGNPTADGSLISYLRGAINNEENLKALTTLLKKVKFQLGDLCVKDQGNGPITLIGIVASNVGSVLGFLGDNPADMIPNIPQLAELAHGALYSLTHDESVLTDRKLELASTLTDPDWKPAGSGSTDGGNDGSGIAGTGTGNGTSNGKGTVSKKNPGGTLPQMGDSMSFASFALMGLGALAAAFKVGRGKDADEWESFDE
ncbi:metallophosphoesterase [Collinsella sp. AF08-23]|uniref:metallophosphoesterase family protein n=1 Tax=Collinsella sp. AF08-23 TaxID=2292211 RepID=UPI000E503836|nr:metallophosphoesterase [Collinsella sp. AF08-23]RHS41564.1 metallophosphoesterase [Collinsella sp. AF08-23]